MLRFTPISHAAFGIIGLGQMGARMGPHVFNRPDCDELVVYDANPASLELLKQHPLLKKLEAEQSKKFKISAVSSASEVAKACPVILTMLPNGPIVREVYTKHIFPHALKGVTCLDCSTTDPTTPQELAKLLFEQDSTALLCDAPVSGGITGAEAGTLAIMVGVTDFNQGSDQKAAFNRANDYLKTFARAVIHCGGIGSGAVCKLCNNLILGQHMVAVSEAMLLAESYGVDPCVLQNVVGNSTGKSWSGDVSNPVPGVIKTAPSTNGYKPGFGVQLMLKDIKLAIGAAETNHVNVPGAKNAMNLFQKTCEADEWKDKDFSIVIKQIKSSK